MRLTGAKYKAPLRCFDPLSPLRQIAIHIPEQFQGLQQLVVQCLEISIDPQQFPKEQLIGHYTLRFQPQAIDTL
jgi:hypothetical protein